MRERKKSHFWVKYIEESHEVMAKIHDSPRLIVGLEERCRSEREGYRREAGGDSSVGLLKRKFTCLGPNRGA